MDDTKKLVTMIYNSAIEIVKFQLDRPGLDQSYKQAIDHCIKSLEELRDRFNGIKFGDKQ